MNKNTPATAGVFLYVRILRLGYFVCIMAHTEHDGFVQVAKLVDALP